jgi:hypothetical protein
MSRFDLAKPPLFALDAGNRPPIRQLVLDPPRTRRQTSARLTSIEPRIGSEAAGFDLNLE